MSKHTEHIKFLRDRRDKLRSEMMALQARVDEIDVSLRALGDETAPPERVSGKVRRGDLKDIVLELFEEAGESGLSSQACISLAKERRGVDLQPASVSSLLSRLKADNVLFFDGERYRMKRYAGPRNPSREAV